jgi:hypothetical protein
MPGRVSSGSDAELTGNLSGLTDLSSATLTASGAVSGGSLAISGASVIHALQADGIDAASLTTSGLVSVGTTLGVSGAATLSSTLNVSGASVLAGLTAGASTLASASVTNALSAGSLSVSGASELHALQADGITAQSLSASGNGSFGGTLNVTGLSTLADVNAANMDLSGDLDVAGASSFAGAITADDLSAADISASGNVSISGTLSVDLASTLHAVSATDISAASLVATGDVASDTLHVTSLSNLHDLDMSGDLDVIGQSTFQGAMTAAAISASGAVVLSSTLDVSGALQAVSANFSDDVVIQGDLTVQGKTTSTTSSDLALADRFIIQNYTLTDPAVGYQTAGGVYVVKAHSAQYTVTAVDGALERFTVSADPSADVEVGDVISVFGLAQPTNNGLFQVGAVGANYIQVANGSGSLVGIVDSANLTTETAPANCKVANVVIKVLRADANGTSFSLGYGHSAASMQFDAITPAGAITMQQTYDNGPEIATADGANVLISGTEALEVTANGGILSNSLDLSSTLDVDGAASFANNITQSNAASSISFAAPLSTSNTAAFGGNTSVAGTFTQSGGGDVHFSGDVTAQADFDVLGATSLTGALSGSSASFSGALSAGAATLSSADISGDLDVGGNADIVGTLASGAATLASLVVSANAGVTGDLSVTGLAHFTGAMDGSSASFSGALDAASASFVGEMASATADISGNADVGGNLVVTGTLDSGAATLASASITNNASVGGTLAVTSTSSFTGAMSGSSASFSGEMAADSADIAANVDIGGDLDVVGAASLASAHITGPGVALDVDANANIDGNLAVGGDLTVAGDISLDELSVLRVGVECVAGEAIAGGSVVCLASGTKKVVKALADDAVTPAYRRAFGICRDTLSSNASGFVSVAGFAPVGLESSQSGTAGAPVYLSASTAGAVTLSAPNGGGNAVVQVGYLAEDISSQLSALIAFQPQFIAQIPA